MSQQEEQGSMSSKLEGKVALITGGARGLGAGIARRFAAEGATVVIADVIDGSETVAELGGGSGNHEYVKLDVSNTPEVESTLDAVRDKHGGLHILCNNAGVAHPTMAVHETPDEEIDRIFAINVRGMIACSRAAARIMIDQGQGGRIINTASQTGKLAWPDWGVYSASKAAVIAVTQVMAVELAPYKITVNAICPGTMVTNMMRTGFGQTAERIGGDRDQMIEEHAKSIPLGRMGTGEDMGAMAAWLASDDASFTTGAALNLTGGEQVFF
jgi:NAD(P)-dependent dehydrogenase (short-subunit alcohol dehydrogenase family)